MCENGIGNSLYHISQNVVSALCVFTVLAPMVKCKKCRLGLGVWIESYQQLARGKMSGIQ